MKLTFKEITELFIVGLKNFLYFPIYYLRSVIYEESI